jgi:hypothetical protein
MGDGPKSGQGTLRDLTDYWSMGPGSKPLRSRWQPIVPPRITVRQEPNLYNDRFFVYIEMATIPGGSIGVKLGPHKGHGAAYRAAEKFLSSDEAHDWLEWWCS